MRNLIIPLLALLFISNSYAGYNANITGKVTQVITYTYSPQILIKVEGQPTSHPECTKLDFMVIDPATPDNIRQLVLSRLLTAYTTGDTIAIGYDKNSSCVNQRIKVYRVG